MVEDDPTIASAIADRMRSEGFEVTIEGNGLVALDVARVIGVLFGAFAFFVLVARDRISPRHQSYQRALVGPSEAFILVSVRTGVLAIYYSSTVAAALAGRQYVARRIGLT